MAAGKKRKDGVEVHAGWTEKGYGRLFWVLALGLFLFHLLYIWLTPYDLAPDEAYYWDWSRHLALGYYSKPPLVAWVIALFTRLGGDHPFFVRAGAVLFSLGSSVVIFYLGRALFNSRVGFWSCIIANVTPGFAVGSVIMTIDPPLIFFWGLTILLLHRALSGKEKWYWYMAGISLGLGLLSKYTIVALVPSLFFYLAFSPTKRSWLRQKEPYLFVLIGLLILSPTLYWNYINQWTSVTQPAGLVDDRNLGSLTTFFWFFGPQAGILSPIIFILVLYGLWQGGKAGLFHHDDRLLFLFCHSTPLLAFFLILSLFSVCYVNWAAPAYFTAFILAVAVVWEGEWREKTKRWVLASALLIGTLISFMAFNLGAVRTLAVALGARIPAAKFPTSNITGWRELGVEVTRLLNEAGRENTFIISYKRQYVSELAFYVKGHPTVYILNLSGHIFSQYDLWEGFEDKVGFNALYITKLDRRPPDRFAKAFDRVEEIKRVKIYAGNELMNGYSIFYCQGFRGLRPRDTMRGRVTPH
jgi:4-amino-4-deoxy-L-arabinose transferase-like glycosyltransferase